jgi:hypothetical protein
MLEPEPVPDDDPLPDIPDIPVSGIVVVSDHDHESLQLFVVPPHECPEPHELDDIDPFAFAVSLHPPADV